jgi:hypothetical protein
MKNLIVLISIGLITISSCKKDEIQSPSPIPKASIPFTGIWERSFNAGPGNPHIATYSIYQDSIRYVLDGSIGQANYVLQRDTFILNENRFIGHTDANLYYLIFVKNITSDSLSLYKQLVTSVNNGMHMNIPSDTTTQNHGWSTYYKK